MELDLGGAGDPRSRGTWSWTPPPSLVFINSDHWRGRTQSAACTEGVLDLPDCCQHPLKAHKNKLSIGLPVGKIDSVHPTVASISSDRVPVTLP